MISNTQSNSRILGKKGPLQVMVFITVWSLFVSSIAWAVGIPALRSQMRVVKKEDGTLEYKWEEGPRGIEALIKARLPNDLHNVFAIPNHPAYAYREGSKLEDHLEAMLRVLNNPKAYDLIPPTYQRILDDSANKRFFEEFILLHDVGKARVALGTVIKEGREYRTYPNHEAESVRVIKEDSRLANDLPNRDVLIEVIRLHGAVYTLTRGEFTRANFETFMQGIKLKDKIDEVMTLLIACDFLDSIATDRTDPLWPHVQNFCSFYEIKKTLEEAVPAAKDIIEKAGEIITDFRSRLETLKKQRKVDSTIVTEADEAVQSAILSSLVEIFPTHRFLGEEKSLPEAVKVANRKNTDSPFTWVIDPIDGTKMFLDSESDFFGTTIGLMYEGRVILALFYPPEFKIDGKPGALFEASELADGVFLNGKAVSIRAPEEFGAEEVIVSERVTDEEFHTDNFGTVIGKTGSETLCLALLSASGDVKAPVGNVYFEGGKFWNSIFGGYFVEKSGGVYIYASGKPVLPLDQNILKTPPYEMPDVTLAGSAKVVDELRFGAVADALGLDLEKLAKVTGKNAVKKGYGVTLLSGYPFSEPTRNMAGDLRDEVENVCQGVVNWQPLEAIHASVSAITRTKTDGTVITEEDFVGPDGNSINLDIISLVARHVEPYTIDFKKIQISPDGNIVLIAESESIEIKRAKRWLGDWMNLNAKYKAPKPDGKIKFFIVLGHIPTENLAKMDVEHARLLKQTIEANQPSGDEEISSLSIVYYNHRTLRGVETLTHLPLGQLTPVSIESILSGQAQGEGRELMGRRSDAAETDPGKVERVRSYERPRLPNIEAESQKQIKQGLVSLQSI